MRDITYDAYKATVVLLTLLETLNTNCRAMAKLGRDPVMNELASRVSTLHSEAENLKRQADEYYDTAHHDIARQILRVARKMNREARVVARFFGIPTREMRVSDLLRRSK